MNFANTQEELMVKTLKRETVLPAFCFLMRKVMNVGELFIGEKKTDGATSSGMSFTMDQYKEDQVLQIINNEYYSEGKESIQRGVAISDLPTGSDLLTRMKKMEDIQKILSTASPEEQQKIIEQYGNSLSSIQRLFIGKTRKNNAGIFLAGPDGKQRLNIYVDENNIPKIEVIDEKGITSNILKQE